MLGLNIYNESEIKEFLERIENEEDVLPQHAKLIIGVEPVYTGSSPRYTWICVGRLRGG